MKRRKIIITTVIIFLFCTNCNTVTQVPSQTPTHTPTFTITPSPFPTKTEPPKYAVTFQSFHDYNGNGELDEEIGEPLLPSININTGNQSCDTGQDGKCQLKNVPAGKITYFVTDPNDKFQWILPSVWESVRIDTIIDIDINQDKLINIPLAEGRYILPFPTNASYEIWTWYDHDENEKAQKNWLGETDTVLGGPSYSLDIRVEDNHCAIDYVFTEGVPVIASDAGEIIHIELDTRQVVPNDHVVIILNEDDIRLNYGHVNILKKFRVGDNVHRGEIIGYASLHAYPYDNSQVFRDYGYMIHQGYDPVWVSSHCQALDPFLPNLWTTSDYELSGVQIDMKE